MNLSALVSPFRFKSMDFFVTDLFIFPSTAVLVGIWWWWWWFSATKRPGNLPPGPRGWPLVGNLFQVILKRRAFIFVVRDLRAKFGPIFTLQMGQRKLIIVTSSELIHEALVRRGPQFATRPPDSPVRLVFSMGKRAINSALYGPLWRTLRRNFVAEVVNPTRIRQCEWIRSWALKTHMERLKTEALDKGFVDVIGNCKLTICSILICLCFGARTTEEEMKQIDRVLKEVMLMTTAKIPDFFPALTPIFRRQLRNARELRKRQIDCLVPLIRARKVFLDCGSSTTFEMPSPAGAAYVDSLLILELPGRKTSGEPSEEELVTLCSEIVSAGTDTSATVLEWALLHLVQDQDIQEKLFLEIKGLVGGNHRPVTEDDVEKLPYLTAVVKETFRRHPPSHFLLSHAATEETELGGYTIPAQASVEFYTAWVTEDPNIWEQPDQFRPDRFLHGDGVDVDVTGTRGVKMVPFGAGRRICPAMTLGTLHISLMLARMVQAYKWLPHPNHPPDPTEAFAFTVVMKNPLKAIIVPRDFNLFSEI